MLDIPRQSFGCGRRSWNRRDLLRVGSLSMSGLTLAQWLGWKAQGCVREGGRAKAVIQLFMLGGPSHLDTWDPKPEAGGDFCGPLKSPIPTNVPGIRISELLPRCAQHADKFSILRGCTHPWFSHETAAYVAATGAMPGGDTPCPALGAVVSLNKGYDAGYQGGLPPYIALTQPLPWVCDTGFLDAKYQAFATFGDPNDENFSVQELPRPRGSSGSRREDRRTLLESVDAMAREMDRATALERMNSFQQEAYASILGDAKRAFDLGLETNVVREQYGRTYFGQCCLLARRLVERGVPFITVHWGWWDTHADNFGAMKANLPAFDQGFAALLQDLSQRGLLESTLVVWHGEFGRTPRIDPAPPWNGGRHHYPLCYSAVVAGGGFEGGAVLGDSDAKGEFPKHRPVYPWDLVASIYALLGISPEAPFGQLQGLAANGAPMQPVNRPAGRLLHEIMNGPWGHKESLAARNR